LQLDLNSSNIFQMAEWRDPCPWRIVEDVGGAYALGFFGGCIFATGKGAYTAPKGIMNKLNGAWMNTRIRAPRYGVSFAAWAFAFSSAECTMIHFRQREDPWNSICSGAFAGAALAARQGKGAMAVSAVFGGIILAVIEGAMSIMNKYQMDQQLAMQAQQQKAFEDYMKQQQKAGAVGVGWGGQEQGPKNPGMPTALD